MDLCLMPAFLCLNKLCFGQIFIWGSEWFIDKVVQQRALYLSDSEFGFNEWGKKVTELMTLLILLRMVVSAIKKRHLQLIFHIESGTKGLSEKKYSCIPSYELDSVMGYLVMKSAI